MVSVQKSLRAGHRAKECYECGAILSSRQFPAHLRLKHGHPAAEAKALANEQNGFTYSGDPENPATDPLESFQIPEHAPTEPEHTPEHIEQESETIQAAADEPAPAAPAPAKIGALGFVRELFGA